MRTVIENKIGLNKEYSLKDISFYYRETSAKPPRSCFYDFAVERGAEFSGYEKGGHSGLLDSINAWFE